MRSYAHEHRPGLSLSRPVLVALVYLALIAVLIYGLMDRQEGDRALGIALFVFLVALNLAAGFVTRTWGTVLLPVGALVLSIPAGYPPVGPGNGDPLPIWWGFAVTAPIAMALVALGVVSGRRFVRRRHR